MSDTSVIIDWGKPLVNMTDEAKELLRQFNQYCDECSKAHDFTCSGADAVECDRKKNKLLRDLYDIADTRRICVVTSNEDNLPCVRHVFRVSDDAEQRLDELKAEYYADYQKLSTDEFHFFTGYYNAEDFFSEYMRK